MFPTVRHQSTSARRSRPRRQGTAPNHVLQLFDTDESLARSVAAFLNSGAQNGETLLVIATNEHWGAIASELAALGTDVEDLRASRRLVVLDAEDMLSHFMRRGTASSALFAQSVAAIVTRVANEASNGLRIYGEMVELLAQDGNYSAAMQVEKLWNELGTRCGFQLLCGYAAAHFAGPGGGSALAAIRGQHSHARSKQSDTLGRFLLTATRKRPLDSTAPESH